MRHTIAVSLIVLAVLVHAAAAGRGARANDEATDVEKAAAALVWRMKSTDSATKKQALIEAASSQHVLVTAALCKSVHDDDEATRTAVLDALAARTDDAAKKSAAVAVAARLDRIVKQKDTAAERLRVIAALHRLAQPASIKSLAANTGFDVAVDELRARLLAIANVPCKEAIEEVISFALTGGRHGDGQDERRKTAAMAFKSAAGADCGHDAIKMRKWWKENEKAFDFKAAAERRAKEAANPVGK